MKNDLLKLVHSLSRNEKGYFKKYSLKHSPDINNNYIRLFNEIEKQSHKLSGEFDDVKFSKKFKAEKFGGQLHVTRNYLYKQLLKSLESFHYTKFKTQRLIMQAKLLSEKYLFAQSWVLTNNALEIATAEEDYLSQLEILDIRLNLMLQSSFIKSGQEQIQAVYLMKKNICEKLNNINEYQFLRYQISLLSAKISSLDNKEKKKIFEDILQNEFLKDKTKAITFVSQIIFYQLNSLGAHYLYNDLHASSGYLESQLNLFESDPSKKQQFRKQYLTCMSSLLLLLKDLNNKEKFFQTLEKYKNEGEIEGEIDTSIFSKSYTIETDFYIINADVSKIDLLYNEIKKGLKSRGDKITPVKRKILLFNCAYLFFMKADFRQSLRLVNQILLEQDINVRADITMNSLWLQLFLFYELENTGLLKKQSIEIERAILESREISRNEKLLLDFFKNDIFPIPDKRQEKKYFLQLKNSFPSADKDPINKYDINIYAWIESKTIGTTFCEAMQKIK
jgi:hypothetical protein